MPEKILKLNQLEAVTVHNRIAQMHEGSRGQKIQRVNFMTRLMKVFPEASGETDLPPSDTREKRDVQFTVEEQRAVAEGLIVLASQKELTRMDRQGNAVKFPVTTSDVFLVLTDAALLSLRKYVETHLASDKVEPFDGELDNDVPLSEGDTRKVYVE